MNSPRYRGDQGRSQRLPRSWATGDQADCHISLPSRQALAETQRSPSRSTSSPSAFISRARSSRPCPRCPPRPVQPARYRGTRPAHRGCRVLGLLARPSGRIQQGLASQTCERDGWLSNDRTGLPTVLPLQLISFRRPDLPSPAPSLQGHPEGLRDLLCRGQYMRCTDDRGDCDEHVLNLLDRQVRLGDDLGRGPVRRAVRWADADPPAVIPPPIPGADGMHARPGWLLLGRANDEG